MSVVQVPEVKWAPDKMVEVEVENMDQLTEAISAGADVFIMIS